MRIFWIILAVILGCLAVGGLVSAAKGADSPSIVGDLVIAGLLALGSAGSAAKARAATRAPSGDGSGRPGRRH